MMGSMIGGIIKRFLPTIENQYTVLITCLNNYFRI